MNLAGLTLSSRRLTTFVTEAGGGFTSFGELAITRGSADPLRGAEGPVLYVRDLDSGLWWATSLLPGARKPSAFAADLGDSVAILRRLDGDTSTELQISLEGDLELRALTLTNHGAGERRLEVTSYAELVLNTAAADAAHPAFSKLFVETSFLPEHGAILATRRLRSPDDQPVSVVHLLRVLSGAPVGDAQVETDRMRFLGRGRGMAAPVALDPGAELSGTTGPVLDPIVAMRRAVVLPPGGSARLLAVTGAADTREEAEALAARCATASFPLRATKAFSPVAALAGDRPGRYRPGGVEDVTPGENGTSSEPLLFDNGTGGFTSDGAEYVIRIPPRDAGRRLPPLPWTHVIANEETGFIVSERGAAHTWSVNSRENRLTPWYNDPVTDPQGEALYLRDEDAGVFWSPTPGPVPAPAAYEARWGFGTASWRTDAFGLRQEVTAFVPRHGPLRVVRLRLENPGPRARRLSIFSYAHWVLGGLPCESPGLRAWVDEESGAVLAVNPDSADFGGRVSFARAVAPPGAQVHLTANRIAFLGSRGDVRDPAALRAAVALDDHTAQVGDGCAAIQVSLEVPPGGTAECAFLLGQAEDEAAAREAMDRFGSAAAIDVALGEVRAFWSGLTGRIRVETPAPAIDLMVNGWLVYQDLCCRIWARSAFYQSGGAFGFRDQLQDAAALLYVDPRLARDQIVLHAAHQFVEGDVLHWWHPPADKGIRTRFSDDLLWLPFTTAFYIRSTGDAAILDERVGYVAARQLEPGEDEAFLLPEQSEETGTLYEHCCRALDRSLTEGAHGLPLIGTGDWNDGMNRVGREGRGESVWLGFFLYAILEEFAPICDQRGDRSRAAAYGEYREHLGAALNDAGWDGEWYRRAYYDDGAPIGSAASDECRIDAIAQAWAVLSGAAPADRAGKALDALERHLVRKDDGLVALLAPPFDRTPHDPGYIKGYLPGVRENGGQYTHGALWAVRALAEAGRCERAAPLLELLSPVSHTGSAEAVERYKAEPYVVAADVYGVEPHVGRAGWTWYTGSAGWMLRVALESVLGLTLEGGRTLRLRPCIPADWPGFSIRYRLPADAGVCDIRVTRCSGPTRATLDAREVEVRDRAVLAPLPRDGGSHELRVELGDDVGPTYRQR